MGLVIRNPTASAPPDAANEQQHETKITGQFAAPSPEPSEVMHLCQAGIVEEAVDFGLGAVLIYRIQSRGVTDPLHAVFCGDSITVRIPAETVAVWAAADEVGLYAQQGALRIAVEKDFRCLTRRPDEQEPDAYPHPAE